jgi:transposase
METSEDRAWCPACGVRAVGHGRRRLVMRDLPLGDRPVVVVWAKRLWRCPEPACPMRAWSEECDQISPRAVLTERARAEIARRVGPAEHSVAQAARDFGVSWHAAMAAVATTAGHGLITSPVSAPRLRSGWLAANPTPWLAGIRHVVIDPYQPYATAVAKGLPAARVVVDHFHVIRLANAALDEIRRRTQQTTTGHGGRKADPLYRIRRRLLASHDRLDPAAFARMLAGLDANDPEGEVGAAYLPKELLRETYLAGDTLEAGRRLVAFYDHCARSEVPELERLARTIARWETPILRWHHTRLTNAATEGTNLIKNIKRLGFGFRNFDNYRLRLLLCCGTPWHTHPVASIRPRQPRISAQSPMTWAATRAARRQGARSSRRVRCSAASVAAEGAGGRRSPIRRTTRRRSASVRPDLIPSTSAVNRSSESTASGQAPTDTCAARRWARSLNRDRLASGARSS